MKLLYTQISYNERWPRKGVMFAPQYLLKKGDELIFNWEPIDYNQKLKIGFESRNSQHEIILPITDKYQSEEDNLTTVLIENLPEYKLYGHLTITLNSDSNNNPFPETKYIYEIRNTGTEKVKKCIDSYIDVNIGANTIQNFMEHKITNILFDSTEEQFDEEFMSKNYIYKQKLFYFEKGQIVNMSLKRPKDSNLYIGASIEKVNSKGFHGSLTENCSFKCNSSDFYIIELFKSIVNQKDKIEIWNDITVYTDINMNPDIKYEIVFNELFRKHEIEPIKASM